MKSTPFRIVSRSSPLAICQAKIIEKKLLSVYPKLAIEIITMQTKGDKWLQQPLDKIGGKGLFVKCLEKKILDNEADIAVHSLKDLPTKLPEGLSLAAITNRDVVFDAMISLKHNSIASLPKRAIVGTASLRRRCQLLAMRPDLNIKLIRGNVGTRINKLKTDNFDAIVLAACGLYRLGIAKEITELFSIEQMLPALAQGALGIECREDDIATKQIIKSIHNAEVANCIYAERSLGAALGGSCHVPLAGLATVENGMLYLKALLGYPDGRSIIKATGKSSILEPQLLGEKIAKQLIKQGAWDILENL